MTDREIFQRNLNHFLESSGKLQRDLADYVGAKYTTVSGWTRGISYPRADSMEKIANFFGIPTSHLIGTIDEDFSLNGDEKNLVTYYRRAASSARSSALLLLKASAEEQQQKKEDTESGQTA